ncbi:MULTISPECIES: hypothetical protein [unclassified Pseudomonas]|uniref:hypothetical protein n=1 Tax=unclassified Pseudomonas TaxID=196821 RepID=UPI000931A881|nr:MULTISPECIES: hypothetical protein [unclassified Pseudomonas]
MTSKLFMLGYTVSRKEKDSSYENDRSKNWADHVRDKILNIQNAWKKHANVETTFTGTIDLDVFYDKAGAAKANISKEISLLLKDGPSQYVPVISLVLLVSGLNEVVEFKM